MRTIFTLFKEWRNIMNNVKELEFVSLVRDTTFKYLFKNEDTRKWLEEIVYDKFNIDLSDFILVDNEDNTGSKVKDYRMDLVLYNQKTKEKIIVEMNGSYSRSSEIKTRKYLYRKAGNGYDKGKDYDEEIKVKLINFNNYYNKNNKDIKNISYSLCSKKYNLEYDDIKIYEIYLKLSHDMCYDECSKIDKRLWLFGTNSFDEMESVLDDDNRIIIEELRRLRVNNEFIDEYDYENVQRKLMNSNRNEGYKEGLEDGITQGITQEKQEIAKYNVPISMDI